MLEPTTLTSSKPAPRISNLGKQSHPDAVFLLGHNKNCTSYNTTVQKARYAEQLQDEIYSNNTNEWSVIH
jgi:hypothetical protein